VAAFFVALYVLWKMYLRIVASGSRLQARLQSLVGNWRVDSKSGESDRRAVSGTTIELEGGELRLGGGTFFAVNADGSKGDAMGNWTVDMAVSDGRRLKYFYTFRDEDPKVLSTWNGLVEVDLQPDPKQLRLEGTWQVLGAKYHRGSISLTKLP